jgi:glycosyltransferase involved in cell wall biosynthesis
VLLRLQTHSVLYKRSVRSFILAKMPRVSVIVPVFNRAATVGRAVSSVVAQTMPDWELIIVDDGSDDDLAGAIANFPDGRLRLLRHDRNRGAAAARNTGIGAARAPLVAFLDSDDEWLPTKLARQVEAIECGGPSLGALCTAFRLRRMRSGYSEDRYPRAKAGWLMQFLDGCFVSPGSTLLARRECFESIGLLDAGLRRFEDWDWLLRLTECYEFDCLPDVLTIVHAGEPPPAAIVAEALRALETRQSARIRARAGAAGLRRFRASLALERAHAAIGARRPFTAIAAATEATLLSPRRAAAFFARGFGRLAAGDV